jgi:hypothetical protein
VDPIPLFRLRMRVRVKNNYPERRFRSKCGVIVKRVNSAEFHVMLNPGEPTQEIRRFYANNLEHDTSRPNLRLIQGGRKD